MTRAAFSRSRVRLAGAVVLAISARVSAQDLTSCEERAARPSIGLAMIGSGTNMELTTGLVTMARNQRYSGGDGPGVAGSGEIPMTRRLGLRVDASTAWLGADLETVADMIPFRPTGTVHLGRVSSSALSLGLVRHSLIGEKLCGYSVLSFGLYEFAFRGSSARSHGGSGTIGVELPFSDRRSAFFGEIQLGAASNHSRAPLASYVALLVTGSAGVRYRF